MKGARKELGSAEKARARTIKDIRKELREAEREHERGVRVSEAELVRRQKEREQRIGNAKRRYDSIRSTLAPMQTARFGKSVLYEDRVVTKQGEALLQRGVTALADTAARIAIARPGAVARLAASGAVNGRAFRSAQGYDARRFYLLIEAPELVALLPCRAGDEEEAREFATRVNVAALNARRIEREREETLGDAQHELGAAESQQDSVLAADDELARAIADTGAIDLARTRLEETEGDTEAIDLQRALVVTLEQEYAQGFAVEQERLAEEKRVEEERRLEEKRRLEEEKREAEAQAEAEQAADQAEGAEAEAEGSAAADETDGDATADASAELVLETVVVMETVDTTTEVGADEALANGEPHETDEATAAPEAENDEPELVVGGEGRASDASPEQA